MKKLRVFFTIIKTGIAGVWKNKSMGFASIISIAAVSIILGIVLIAALTMNLTLTEIQTRVDEVEIYVRDDVPDDRIQEIQAQLQTQPGIQSLQFKTKEDALEEMRKVWGEDAYILEGLEQDNPLERSFLVSVEKIEDSHGIVEFARGLDGVTNIIYFQDAVDRLVSITDYVRLGGLVVILILIVISILVISNTVKLTVLARKKEIEVMKYVGASNGMISGPFIIEGMIFGLMGAALAFLVTYFSYIYIYNRFNDQVYAMISSYLIEPIRLREDLIIIFSTLGIVIGTVGSVFSLKRYLRV
ncbi:MAG: permease-like cell division protein FtsX [Tissierellia bacterium]|nr:permease-like cell division protein FtsX [Tissierellia bacterium]